MRYMNTEGTYVVKFKQDTVINVGYNDEGQYLRLTHMPHKKL